MKQPKSCGQKYKTGQFTVTAIRGVVGLIHHARCKDQSVVTR